MRKLLEPISFNRGEPLYSRSDTNTVILNEIKNENHFNQRAKSMSKDMQAATNMVNETTNLFNTAIDNLCKKEAELTEKTKKVSGNVRNTGNQLHEGLQKIEKAANFDRLEKYVTLLERAAQAMETLAELEKEGKLEKIAASLR